MKKAAATFPPLAELVELGNCIDGFYALLGVEKNADKDAIRKAYKRRSLKLHPDKGGNTAVYQNLNRAFFVLHDAKRRKRYDLVGLDIDEDKDVADAPSDTSDEDTPSTHFAKESEQIRSVMTEFGVRVFQVMVSLLVVQYTWLLALASLVLVALGVREWWTSHQTAQTQESQTTLMITLVTFGISLFAGWLMWWSTSSGWLFWAVESFTFFLLIFQGGVIGGVPLPRVQAAAVFGGCVVLAWWFNGRLWPYFCLLLFIVVATFMVWMFFTLAGMAVDQEVEATLKKCAPKLRREVERLRQQNKALRRRVGARKL